jgi:hypothetical protein
MIGFQKSIYFCSIFIDCLATFCRLTGNLTGVCRLEATALGVRLTSMILAVASQRPFGLAYSSAMLFYDIGVEAANMERQWKRTNCYKNEFMNS